jgi:hypothetical protein
MSTNTSDRFFSMVIGLAILEWPSIEGSGAESGPGSRGDAGEKARPGRHSEETNVSLSSKKKRTLRSTGMVGSSSRKAT